MKEKDIKSLEGALRDKDMETIKKSMANLTSSVDKGFAGVHQRQDTTNGNVIKNTEHRLKTEAQISLLRWILGFIGISNMALLLKIFL